MKVPADALSRLRVIRAWHWEQAIGLRRDARNAWNEESRQLYDKLANFHIQTVQTLNDFFPSGDTAEKDVDKLT